MSIRNALQPGRRIPALDIEQARAPRDEREERRRIRLRPERRFANVVVSMHAGCADCAGYLERLAEEEEDVRHWDGRIVAVLRDEADVPPGMPDHDTFRFGLWEPRLEEAGLTTPMVLIIDQWGELHDVRDAGADHDFPTPDDVVQWLRYLSIQCPECQGEAL